MKGKETSGTEIEESNFTEASLGMWQERFKRIYGKKNQRLRPEDLWFRVFENSSKVAENLRRYKYAAAFQSLAHVTCWLLGFTTRINRDMEDVVWGKYPYICPYCRKEKETLVRPCSCGTARAQLEEAESHMKEGMIQNEMVKYYADAFRDKRPSKLDDWVSMYDEIYGNITYSIPAEHIGFHLMEEIGEVSRILRRKKEFEKRVREGLETDTDIKKAIRQFEHDLDSELADVFSWTCTLVNKIQSLAKALKDFEDQMQDMKSGRASISIQFSHTKATSITFEVPEATFSSVLYWEYGNGCPNCSRIPCSDDCFLRECKYMTRDGKCGFDWTDRNICDYGKSSDQSNKCGGS